MLRYQLGLYHIARTRSTISLGICNRIQHQKCRKYTTVLPDFDIFKMAASHSKSGKIAIDDVSLGILYQIIISAKQIIRETFHIH
jgi:hypothetical protein